MHAAALTGIDGCQVMMVSKSTDSTENGYGVGIGGGDLIPRRAATPVRGKSCWFNIIFSRVANRVPVEQLSDEITLIHTENDWFGSMKGSRGAGNRE